MSDSKDLQFTRNYIRLFQMQLHGVLEDMAAPSDRLSSKFSDVLIKMHEIKDSIVNLTNSQDVELKMNNILQELFECVTNMQFLDAKRQRLENVSDGLSYLIETNEVNSRLKYEWDKINYMVIDLYKMDSERKIYQAYLQESDTSSDEPSQDESQTL